MNKQIILMAIASIVNANVWAQRADSASIVQPRAGHDTGHLSSLSRRIEALEAYTTNRAPLSISGYVQLYHQTGQQDAELSVGNKREEGAGSFSRLGVRRGHIKLSYTRGIAQGVFQIDLTDRGVGVRDAYLQIRIPHLGRSALRGGIFERPFGHEISYSSALRESPERALITRTLFPNGRDLGVMFSLQAGQESKLSFLRLDAGLFGGNGIKSEVDSRLDFIGRLSAQSTTGRTLELSGGVSLYYGGVYQGSPEVYRITNGQYTLETNASHIGQYARRSYLGLDAQLALRTTLGTTRLRGEWITGQQPASASSSKSPNGTLAASATYLRPIQGGYILLAQEVGRTPLVLLAKYDWYDPNTALSGDAIGLSYSGVADLAYRTIGLGLQYHLTSAIRATAYAELITNEATSRLTAYQHDLRDDRVTLALQYRF